MGAKGRPETVSAVPLFAWFALDKKNRRRFVEAGYSDGRLTNWKNRGIPRGEVAAVAELMGTTHDDYLVRAGGKVAQQPRADYLGLSEEALEIARAFDQLQPQARDFIREQVFIYTVIDKSFPWLRHGKPIGKSYNEFERWHQENIEAKRDFDLQHAGLKPSEPKK